MILEDPRESNRFSLENDKCLEDLSNRRLDTMRRCFCILTILFGIGENIEDSRLIE